MKILKKLIYIVPKINEKRIVTIAEKDSINYNSKSKAKVYYLSKTKGINGKREYNKQLINQNKVLDIVKNLELYEEISYE